MKYNLHFYKNNILKEIKIDNAFMYGKGNKFISIESLDVWDKIVLFDEDGRYIVTYYFDSKSEGKLVFKR